MGNSNVSNVTLITIGFLKGIMSNTCHWTVIVIDQTIKQGCQMIAMHDLI